MTYLIGYVWLIAGIGAAIAAVFGIVWAVKGKSAKWFRFISMALTAVALCAFYSQAGVWAAQQDWSALADVLPTVSGTLWVLTAASIGLNGISLIRAKNE